MAKAEEMKAEKVKLLTRVKTVKKLKRVKILKRVTMAERVKNAKSVEMGEKTVHPERTAGSSAKKDGARETTRFIEFEHSKEQRSERELKTFNRTNKIFSGTLYTSASNATNRTSIDFTHFHSSPPGRPTLTAWLHSSHLTCRSRGLSPRRARRPYADVSHPSLPFPVDGLRLRLVTRYYAAEYNFWGNPLVGVRPDEPPPLDSIVDHRFPNVLILGRKLQQFRSLIDSGKKREGRRRRRVRSSKSGTSRRRNRRRKGRRRGTSSISKSSLVSTVVDDTVRLANDCDETSATRGCIFFTTPTL
ncbi:unnamed protein product, partial [Nesidiocoris tenuis]